MGLFRKGKTLSYKQRTTVLVLSYHLLYNLLVSLFYLFLSKCKNAHILLKCVSAVCNCTYAATNQGMCKNDVRICVHECVGEKTVVLY